MSDPVIGAAIATNGKFVLAIDIKESFDVAIKEVVVRYIIEEGGDRLIKISPSKGTR